MSVVWSHKIQEKQADILTKHYKRLEIIRIGCGALTSAGLISLIFMDQFAIKIISTFISFISTLISMLFQSFDTQKSITNHKNTANELLVIRNQFQLLLVDIKMKNKDKTELMKNYSSLVNQLADIYRTASNTTCKAIEFESVHPFIDGNGRTGRLLVNLELMKAGFPPIDIKFTDRLAYYQAFDTFHSKGNPSEMEDLFARYLNERLDQYLFILE